MSCQLRRFIATFLVAFSNISICLAFQIQHHHPIYVQYYKEKLEKEFHRPKHVPSSDAFGDQGTRVAFVEQALVNPNTGGSACVSITSWHSSSSSEVHGDVTFIEVDADISTPISYDEETGMVQTAVRAIVKNPIASFVDHHIVSLSSTLVISLGAVHELVDCLELEWAHHATSSTEGLAILSLGHALHYGRETIRQLVEFDEKTNRGTGHNQD